MGVHFYILVLLIASPVKQEDACQTNKKQGNKLPTVTIDTSVTEYEYGHAITLTWFIADPTLQFRREQFIIQVANEPEQVFQCDQDNDCTRYKLPEPKEPGDYNFELHFTFSKGAKFENIDSHGSFKVKDPSVSVVHPVEKYLYEKGQDVILEWSTTYGTVPGLKILVWETKTPEDYIPCQERIDNNKCKLPKVPLGSYQWVVEGESPVGQTMKCQLVGSFIVVETPTPEHKTESKGFEIYAYGAKILIDWNIVDPMHLITSYQVLVWTRVDNLRPDWFPLTTFPVDCPDIKKCNQHELKLDPGAYQCKIQATSRTKETKMSAKYRRFGITDPALPTVTMDKTVVKDVFEYGNEITLKWSLADPNQTPLPVEKIDIQVFKDNSKLMHWKEVRCLRKPAEHCSHYKLPVLEPGDFAFELDFTFLILEDNISKAFGSFKIKDPPLQVIRPVRNQEYEHGEDFSLEWSMTYGKFKVTRFKITVTEMTSPEDATVYDSPCINDNVHNHYNLSGTPPGVYQWTIEATTSEGQTMKSQVVGSFIVIAIPVPELSEPLAAFYTQNEEIVVGWSIKDPYRIVTGYKVLLWKQQRITDITSAKLDAKSRPIYPPADESYDTSCGDTTKCRYPLPRTKRNGGCIWMIEAETRQKHTRRSLKFGYFLISL